MLTTLYQFANLLKDERDLKITTLSLHIKIDDKSNHRIIRGIINYIKRSGSLQK